MNEEFDIPRRNANLSTLPEPGSSVPPPADSGWWFTVSAYVVAILTTALAPDLAGTWARRALAATGLMAGSFGSVWLVRMVLGRCHRLRSRWVKGHSYDGLYEIAARHARDLEASQALVRRLLSASPSYTGISVSVFGGYVRLEITKKGKRAIPAPGQILNLVDLENSFIIGTFEVTQSDGKLAQAKDRGDLDALFRGYALKTSARFLPENMALFTLPEKDGLDE